MLTYPFRGKIRVGIKDANSTLEHQIVVQKQQVILSVKTNAFSSMLSLALLPGDSQCFVTCAPSKTRRCAKRPVFRFARRPRPKMMATHLRIAWAAGLMPLLLLTLPVVVQAQFNFTTNNGA